MSEIFTTYIEVSKMCGQNKKWAKYVNFDCVVKATYGKT